MELQSQPISLSIKGENWRNSLPGFVKNIQNQSIKMAH